MQARYRRSSELHDSLIRTGRELPRRPGREGFAGEEREIARFRGQRRHPRPEAADLLVGQRYQPVMGLLTQINMLVLIGFGGYW